MLFIENYFILMDMMGWLRSAWGGLEIYLMSGIAFI
jgi:hypothetical protein